MQTSTARLRTAEKSPERHALTLMVMVKGKVVPVLN
jgi:hypothetical protein